MLLPELDTSDFSLYLYRVGRNREGWERRLFSVLAGEELFGGGGAVEDGELLILLEGVLVVEAFEGSLVRLSAELICCALRGGGAGRCDGCAKATYLPTE